MRFLNKVKEFIEGKSRIRLNVELIIVWSVLLTIMYFVCNDYIFARICILSSTIIFIVEIYMIYKNTQMIFAPIIIFLLSFYLFQTGTIFIKVLDSGYINYYLDSLIYLLPKAALFTSISNVLAGLAGVIVSSKNVSTLSPINRIDNNNPGMVSKLAAIPIIIFALVLIPFCLYEFIIYGIHGGRFEIIRFEDGLSLLIKFVRIFRILFGPFVLLYISFSDNKKNKRIFAILLIVWCVLETLNGNRTNSLSALLAIILLGYYRVIDKQKKKKIAIGVCGFGFILMTIIIVSASFRIGGKDAVAIGSPLEIIIRFVEELGGSSFVLFAAMHIVPGKESFLFGLEYLDGFLKGIIPSTLDFTGIIGKIASDFDIFDRWIEKHFAFNFGLGQSINQEAYINFGWIGLIAIFFICIFIFRNFSHKIIVDNKIDKYALYKTSTLIALFIMLPRQSLITMWNGFFWGILAINIYILVAKIIVDKLKEKYIK